MAITELPIAPTREVRAPADVGAATPTVRLYFGVLALLSLGAFVFGVENRFISDGLIRVPPPVDWIPPLSAQEWSEHLRSTSGTQYSPPVAARNRSRYSKSSIGASGYGARALSRLQQAR
jgi:hypothetical protein